VANEDRLRELEEKYEDYKVYDNQGQRIGKVDDLFIDEEDHEEYIGVKMGFFGMRSTLIPMDIVRVNESERSMEVSDTKDHVKSAPSFDDDEDITPDYEDRIRSYFGLESLGTPEGGYATYSDTDDTEDDTREYENHSSIGSEESAEPATEGHENAPEESRESSGTGSAFGDAISSTEDPSGTAPTTRETEETETFREGGRTKIRRRVIREEIIEEDAPDNQNP
jgi:sporulation protein YlmC with PRC-barrel domain